MKVYIIIFIIFFLVFIIFYAFYRFQDGVFKEKESLFNAFSKSQYKIRLEDLKDIPNPLKNYLQKSGVLGKYKDGHVTFKQQGKLKTSMEKKWTSFRAVQYMTASCPNFIWSAQIYPLFIRDKSIAGKGEVKVNLFGFKDIAKFEGLKTDESSLTRCLGELMFYPVGFLSENISWEVLDKNQMKAKVHVNGLYAEGIFYFDDKDVPYRFEAKRYKEEVLEDFTGLAEDFKTLDGLFIPTKMTAIWNLKEGDFEYFNATITSYAIE